VALKQEEGDVIKIVEACRMPENCVPDTASLFFIESTMLSATYW